ncbi:Hypothetical protein NGAL_HAMBI2605_55950 [Neorhizobium galegae bv. orientalis]|nr:Hypothetical protein NGAL_HAMBI2605_55950 [Neorhizobium galegae bv. orientalis]CDZ73999.1 Hypothetical protein NGAL_HAMBI2610_56310 [Neorhizobium galegae bv. orientalis]
MAENVKEVCDRVVDGNKALKLPRGLEALHNPLTPSDRLMRVFRPIVQAFMRAVFDTRHDIAFCCAIGAELFGDYHTLRTALPFQKLSHQPFDSLGIATVLHRHVENKAVLINGAPLASVSFHQW